MTGGASCVPVSWLRLERYALGELPPAERSEIADHLATCGRCRTRAELIADDSSREFPPLPALPTSPKAPVRSRRPGWFALLTLASAAVAVLLVVRRPADEPRLAGRRIAVKGGEVTVELVRESGGSIGWEPTSFAPSDRFKLLLTCAPPLRVYADIVVLQGDRPDFPGAASLISCANRVPLVPAFRITGPDDATVCVAIDPAAPPPRDGRPDRQSAASGQAACVHLDRRP